jgi:hypothetical protein
VVYSTRPKRQLTVAGLRIQEVLLKAILLMSSTRTAIIHSLHLVDFNLITAVSTARQSSVVTLSSGLDTLL